MRRVVAIAALMLAGISSTALADVYRSVDEQGRVQYSDRWVPGAVLVKVTGSSTSAEDLQRIAREHEQLTQSNDRIAAQQTQQGAERAVQQDLAKIREQQCKDAKQRYQTAIESRRLFRTREDGEREYLSDSEADAWRVQSRVEMEQACGTSAR